MDYTMNEQFWATVLVLLAVFLLIREIICWYFKINERLRIMKRILAVLEHAHGKPPPLIPPLPPLPKKAPEAPTDCPRCFSDLTPEGTCPRCGYPAPTAAP